MFSLTNILFLMLSLYNEERLWTSYNKLAKDPRQVTGRLAHFRCLLNQRGVAAAPLAGPGRVAPEEPGSCYAQ
jgi:hexosaminidase